MKKNRVLLYLISLLQGMVFYGAIALLYRQACGVTVFQITIIEAVSLGVMIVFEIPWGFVADRIGYKNTIVISNLIFFISKLVFWKAEGFLLFLIERILLAIALSGLSGCTSAFLYVNTSRDKEKKVFGIYEATSTMGLLFATVFYSMVIREKFRLGALLTVGTYLAAFIMSIFLTETKGSDREKRSEALSVRELWQELMGDKHFLLFLVAAALISETNQTITVFFSQLQYKVSGIDVSDFGYLNFLVTIVGMSALLTNQLAKITSEKKVIQGVFILGVVACILLASFQNPLASVVGILLLRTAASVFVPIKMSILNRQVTNENRATVLSAYSMFMSGVGMSTNLIFGKGADVSIRTAMIIGALFCFAGLGLYMRWERSVR